MENEYNKDEFLIGKWVLGLGGTVLLPPLYAPNLIIGLYESYMQYSTGKKSHQTHENDYIAGYFEWCKNILYGTILLVVLIFILLFTLRIWV